MVTDSEHKANLVANAFHREAEVYSYQVNIDNYGVMLLALPTEDWPVNLLDYKATPIEQLPAGMDEETVDEIADLQYRDRIVGLLRTEKVEQKKASRVLDALKAQIGETYAADLAAYKAANG